jgi:hypothetical protein
VLAQRLRCVLIPAHRGVPYGVHAHARAAATLGHGHFADDVSVSSYSSALALVQVSRTIRWTAPRFISAMMEPARVWGMSSRMG